jgi:hypothetical protein
MKKRILFTVLFLAALTCPLLWSQDLTATEILERVDRTINAPEDQEMEATLILIDDKGNERTRVIQIKRERTAGWPALPNRRISGESPCSLCPEETSTSIFRPTER